MSDGLTQIAFQESAPCAPPDWEIRREIGPGYFRTYAHGYWKPLILVVLGRVVYGRRALRRTWANV